MRRKVNHPPAPRKADGDAQATARRPTHGVRHCVVSTCNHLTSGSAAYLGRVICNATRPMPP